MVPTNPLQGLSADLVPFISQPDASMLVAQVYETQWTRRIEQDLEVEAGPVPFGVLEVLHGQAPRTGEFIWVPARRIADPLIRVRNQSDRWNALPLRPGDILILAVRPTGDPRFWMGLAAKQVASAEAAEVAAVRRCYVMEEFQGSDQQRSQMLAEALRSGQDLLRFYALDYLRRHVQEARVTAVQLISNAIASAGIAPDHRLQLGTALAGQTFFVRDRKADEANQTVVAALATGLVHESDPRKRTSWARILASCVLMEFSAEPGADQQVRSALIRSPRNPPAQQVIPALGEAFLNGAPDEKTILDRLLKAWQSA